MEPALAVDCPAAHTAHAGAEAAGWYLDGGHAAHETAPAVGAKRPGRQPVHVAAPLLVLPVGPAVPFAHAVPSHATRAPLADAYVPPRQAWQPSP